MTAPTTTIEFGYGSTWKTADGSISWTDETAYVRNEQRITVDRGRRSERDDFAAGTCSFTLNNSTRRFDPQYAAGPLYGQLVPGVPVRIRSVANGVTSDVFRGFVHGWPQRYYLGNTLGVVPIIASDGFRRLARADLPASVWVLEASADDCYGWWRLAESTGDVLTDSSGNGHHAQLQYQRVEDLTKVAGPAVAVGDPLVKYDPSPSMGFLCEPYGTGLSYTPPIILTLDVPTSLPLAIEAVVVCDPSIGILDRWVLALESAGTVHAGATFLSTSAGGRTFAPNAFASSAATYKYNNSGPYFNMTDQAHHVVWLLDDTGNEVYIDGVLVSVASSTTTPPALTKTFLTIAGTILNFGVGNHSGRMSDVRLYESWLSTTRIAAHADAAFTPWDGDTADERITRILDYLGWPAGLRDLSAGDTVLGPTGLGGKALPFLKAIEASEQGRLFIGKNGKVVFLNRYWGLYNTKGNTVQVTLSDDGADTGYSDMGFDYDDELVFNSATGSRLGGATITVTDPTSSDAYGFSADSELSGLQLSSDYWVQSMLEYRVDRYKDPQQRLPTMKIPLHGLTAAKQSALLELELAYRVNAERTPQAVGTAIDVDEHIEGIHHDIGVAEHWMTFNLSTVDTRKYAIWGTSTWDNADSRWGF